MEGLSEFFKILQTFLSIIFWDDKNIDPKNKNDSSYFKYSKLFFN